MTKCSSPLCTTSLALFAAAVLAACGQQTVQPSAETSTLRLERLENGDLQYCEKDAATDADCTTLPYDGKCETIEIDINLSTGGTCERCITADGEVIDRGCNDTYVACTLVTIPNPDCVVCAYVNGNVIHSTCIAEEPQCRSDADCRDGFGNPGACRNGECVYRDGCTSNAECADNETCQLDYCPDRPCFEDEGCPPCYGRCVPNEPIGCELVDCAPGHHCEIISSCDADTTNSDGTDPNCTRAPVCVPDDNLDPCATVRCAAGTHCEVVEVCDGTTNTDPATGECRRAAECVPDNDPTECRADADCPDGQVCREFCTMGPCHEDDPNCGTCFGTCVPAYDNPCDDVTCRDGQHCELQEVQCVRAPCPPLPVCVDDPKGCETDKDCADNQACMIACPSCLPGGECPPCFGQCVDVAPQCHSNEECRTADGREGLCWEGACHYRFNCDASTALCDMIPPTCRDGQSITVVGGCFGPCVDKALCEPTDPGDCRSNADCPQGSACVEVCVGGGCAPDGSQCDIGCWGVCQPVDPPSECNDDADCPDNATCAVVCVDCAPDATDCQGGCWGTCVPNAPECRSDADCLSSAGTQGRCVQGQCYYDPNECRSDDDCAAGQACVTECANICSTGSSDCPAYCKSACVDLPDPPTGECKRTGCSGQICAAEEMASTCEWRPEYACFDKAICELQNDGGCGWTLTDDVRQCLENIGSDTTLP